MAAVNDPWMQIVVNIGIGAFSHPMGYVKTLIQLGYEPLPPRLGRNAFFRECYQLPGFLPYARHIYSVEGFSGLYRGFFPALCQNFISGAVLRSVSEKMDELFPVVDESEKKALAKKRPELASVSFHTFMLQMSKDSVAHLCAVVVSQPFNVIMIRSMAQFIGKETKYSGWISPYFEVYNDSGIRGLFTGLAPRLLLDLMTLWLARTMYYSFNRLVVDENMTNVSELRSYANIITGFLASMLTYPFSLISSNYIVNNSGLLAGTAPYVPVYMNWVDCWRDLRNRGLLKRGSSLFFRRYNAKMVVFQPEPVTPLD
ncbi:mitochondrial carrier homolog 2-like [Strongylocentrotus purpuratus]|uniref:Mitochondrial carrier homolog 2 n=1 Tax=Strongylocentrotus purpuratus TaxID=7668 RepID=A0A7M7PEL4_STRPU|nr:mitochondrial carrier homolog 2-like [Strongylocentrotus purpuratus]